MKRIVGSFTEASAFAYATLGLLAFNLRLWSEGIASRITGPIAILSIVALLFATSSTGYVGLATIFVIQFAMAIRRLLLSRAAPNTVILLALAPIAAGLCVAGIALTPALSASVSDLIDTTLFNKLSSDSGIERGAWNRQALKAIADTSWLGAGIGSLRASSWLIAVPANVGVIGTAFYLCFILAVLTRHDRSDTSLVATLRAAGKHACVAQMAAASVAGSFIDLGLSFFLFAGVVCGIPTMATQVATSDADAGNDERSERIVASLRPRSVETVSWGRYAPPGLTR